MAFGDLTNVTLLIKGRKEILDYVFRYTGSSLESTTPLYLHVMTTNLQTSAPEASVVQEVRFREFTGSGGSTGTRIQDYAVAIPANRRVYRFDIRTSATPSSGADVAIITLEMSERRDFETAGVLYIDRIAFDMNATVL